MGMGRESNSASTLRRSIRRSKKFARRSGWIPVSIGVTLAVLSKLGFIALSGDDIVKVIRILLSFP